MIIKKGILRINIEMNMRTKSHRFQFKESHYYLVVVHDIKKNNIISINVEMNMRPKSHSFQFKKMSLLSRNFV